MSSVSPSLFGHAFSSELSLSFDTNGVIVNSELIDWQSIISPVAFDFGWLGQTISFSTRNKHYKFSMRAYSASFKK